MKKEFNFEKKGYVFNFRNPKLDRYGKLAFEFKVPGVEENARNDGFYLNAKFNVDKKAIIFPTEIKFNGQPIKGVSLPDEVFEEVKEVNDDLKAEREAVIGGLIDSIIAGEVLIDWKIVGCDYPHYQPWLNNLPEDLNGLEQNIMERAITKFTGEKYISNPCEYLERKIKQGIAKKDTLHSKAVSLSYNEESQQYYNFNSEVVTSFQIKLEDIIDIEKIKQRQEDRRIKDEEIEKRRNSLKLEILSSGQDNGSDGVDYYAKIKLTDEETGESLQFMCRNIFDVGYVINPEYEIAKGIDGGIIMDGQWHDFESGKGWYPVRELTDFEAKCIKYLKEFSPISKNVRL